MTHVSDLGCFVTSSDSLIILDPNKIPHFISNDLSFRHGGKSASMPLQMLYPIKQGLWSVYIILSEPKEGNKKDFTLEEVICVSTPEMEWNFSSMEVLNSLNWTEYVPQEGVLFPFTSEIDVTGTQVGIFCLESLRNVGKNKKFNIPYWLNYIGMLTTNKIQAGLSDLPNSPIGCLFSPLGSNKINLNVVSFPDSNEIWAFRLSKLFH